MVKPHSTESASRNPRMRSVKGQVLSERGEFSRLSTASRILAGAVVGEAPPLADTERGGVIAQKKREEHISVLLSGSRRLPTLPQRSAVPSA